MPLPGPNFKVVKCVGTLLSKYYTPSIVVVLRFFLSTVLYKKYLDSTVTQILCHPLVQGPVLYRKLVVLQYVLVLRPRVNWVRDIEGIYFN